MFFMRHKIVLVVSGGIVVGLVALGLVVLNQTVVIPTATHKTHLPAPTPSTLSLPVSAPSAAQLAAAPEARYDAVIPGLIPYASDSIATASHITYQLAADTALFGVDQRTVVARLPATNFLRQPTVVVPVKTSGDWVLILTPARNALPSSQHNLAAAQTAGWVHQSALTHPTALTQRVVISTTARTLTIMNLDSTAPTSFPIGVGTATTPTPTGVTGYLQARYLDPAQGQSKYPIQLTSLHSAVGDNPYGGVDGGLVGIHFQTLSTGAVSHGCIRVPVAAITAINLLPLGTSISIKN